MRYFAYTHNVKSMDIIKMRNVVFVSKYEHILLKMLVPKK